jgi:hypothetical protein
LLSDFRQVVQRLAMTMLLVVGGFFENPYMSAEGHLED